MQSSAHRVSQALDEAAYDQHLQRTRRIPTTTTMAGRASRWKADEAGMQIRGQSKPCRLSMVPKVSLVFQRYPRVFVIMLKMSSIIEHTVRRGLVPIHHVRDEAVNKLCHQDSAPTPAIYSPPTSFPLHYTLYLRQSS